MNKRLFLFLSLLTLSYSSVIGQMRNAFSSTTEGYVDFDLRFGGMTNTLNRVDMSTAYSNPVNYKSGNMTITNSKANGFEAKVGYFVNEKKTWGITVGLIYAYQTGHLSLDTFHIEYKTADSNKRTYRQIISAHPIAENLNGSAISVPFMAHYQIKTSPIIFYSIDAGFVYNVTTNYNFSSNTSVNYEAIYKYDAGSKSFVYDSNPVVSGSGTIPITLSQYYATNPKGTDPTSYFAELSQKWGANVGLSKAATNKTGSVSYQHGSIGFIAEPTFNYQISDVLFLKIGLYYVNQQLTTNGTGNQQVFISKTGTYNGLLNEVKTVNATSYGINVGVKFLLKDNIEESIRYITYF